MKLNIFAGFWLIILSVSHTEVQIIPPLDSRSFLSVAFGHV